MKEDKKLLILFVDDEQHICLCFKSLIENSCQARVITANRGKLALELMEKNEFDILITDIIMPEMDGIELAEEVLKKYQIPIILITGFNSEEILPLGFDKNIVCCIPKPYTITDVKNKVREAFSRFGKSRNEGE